MLGIQANGELAPATRGEMEEAIRSWVATHLNVGVQTLRKANQEMLREYAALTTLNKVTNEE